ncbi:MAG: metal-dependent hydrolase [Candidatus Sericytochromatia bacterium]|nr:metal-dependent hydrolase [Candidatus Sericytochromatia bacterium]
MTLGRETTFTWLGHATFAVTTPGGQSLLLDPWVQSNPACPEALKDLPRVDAMLLTHGHFDHVADAVSLAKAHACPTVGIFELCHWLGRQGVSSTLDMNKGGTVEVAGVHVTMVHADHSCGIQEADGSIVYGGEAVGYVVRLENGFTFYFAGDTNVFGDMALIGELYRPDLAILPIGGHYVMGPREAAKAVELLGVKQVIPMHFGTFPVLAGTPEDLQARVASLGCQVLAMRPGETLR